MRKIILASHGNLAEGMLRAATVIGGVQEHLSAYGLDEYETPQGIYEALYEQITENTEDEFLILCDIRGGSVHNKLIEYCINPNVHVITGMNLAMVLDLIFAPSSDTVDVVKQAVDLGKENIVYIDEDILNNKSVEEEEIW